MKNPILKKNNQRLCIWTRVVQNKTNLIRIVMTKDGNFEVNSNKKGRGAYISKNIKQIDKIMKKKILHRIFKTNVPDEVYDKLIKEVQRG